MGFVKDTFFGGAEKEAAKREQEALIAGGETQRQAFLEAGETQADFIRRATEGAAPALGLAATTEADMLKGITGGLSPLASEGMQASRKQAALSGALGPEAQAQAFQSFQESPGVSFLRDQGLRQIESGMGARGKLGSGAMLRELTKFSQGLALQDLGRQTQQLSSVAGRGIGVLGAQTGLRASEAGLRAQAIRAPAITRQQALLAEGQAMAQGISGAGQAFGQAQQLTGPVQSAGVLGRVEGLREGISGFTQGGLQGLATGESSSASGGGGGGAGGLSKLDGLLQTGMTMFSDERLKTNIVKIGALSSGLSWYKWDWNDLGKKIAKGQRTMGVIAQEAMLRFPHAVSAGEDGYLRVNYGRIS